MEQPADRVEVADIAAHTIMAAHGRDHTHAFSVERCHPHEVQIVFLGRRAMTVCHDCRDDSGFLPRREAERLASGHRDETRGADVALLLRAAGRTAASRSHG